MRKVILMPVIAFGTLLSLSCKKNNNNTPQIQKNWVIANDEYDHRPIIIVKVVDVQNNPLVGAKVWVYNSNDSVFGITDVTGTDTADVPTLGNWNISASLYGFNPNAISVVTLDSVQSFTDTL